MVIASTTKKKVPTVYVVKAGHPVEKYSGYAKVGEYSANERVGVCDCTGFMNRSECKHLVLKSMLQELKVEEFLFFGTSLGECKPKTGEQITKIAEDLTTELTSHFNFESLGVHRFIPAAMVPDRCGAIEFVGKRKGGKDAMIVGYFNGVLFTITPNGSKAAGNLFGESHAQ